MVGLIDCCGVLLVTGTMTLFSSLLMVSWRRNVVALCTDYGEDR